MQKTVIIVHFDMLVTLLVINAMAAPREIKYQKNFRLQSQLMVQVHSKSLTIIVSSLSMTILFGLY